ncbi:hypothetical protein CATYP_04155 [Corynebacterium atypicum]|uniref:DUF4439 domain-containing protein n=1 Tax=Corynebacterium atypicum TaxID=191610 RepID=A0ABM5QMH5_9CORY|nr:hypothetical protein [Corynebacterium atypicum]AIG63978.1 hypothetical protein CATYP_04155 [Corynebacterium atypicum]
MTSPTRRAAALALAATCLTAAACTPGPRPNAALTELAQRTLAFAQATGSPTADQSAKVLFTEVERLCGQPLPQTCQPERTPEAPPADAAAVSAYITEVPEESAELVATQAVERTVADAGSHGVELPPATELAEAGRKVVSNTHDAAVLADLLRWEQSLRYGLTAAAAWSNSPEVDQLVAGSDERAAMLSELLAATGREPAAAAGYEFSAPPNEVIAEAREQTVRTWTKKAPEIRGDEARELVILGAAHAQSQGQPR